MSTRVMAAVWPLQMSPTQKAVLVSLSDNANDAGFCWPSIATICKRTCYGKTAVIEAIKSLEEAGYLTANRSNGRHTTYVVNPNPPLQPLRKANQSGSPTGAADEPVAVRETNKPVRQPDSNRQEPSLNRQLKKEQPRSQGSRLLVDWKPSRGDIIFAESRGIDPSVEAEKFRDYWHAVAGARGRKQDWHATWRNWVRRSVEYSRQGRRSATEDKNEQVAAAWVSGKTGLDNDPTASPLVPLGARMLPAKEQQ